MLTPIFILFGLLVRVQGTGFVTRPTLQVKPVHTQSIKVVEFTDPRTLTVK